MNISEKLKQLRLSNNLSQEEMAKIIGKSQQVYANLETGKTKRVDTDVVKTIKNHFNVDLLQEKIVEIESDSNNEDSELRSPGIVISMKTIFNLSENNKIIAESQKIVAESNKIVAESNKKLIDTNAELTGLVKLMVQKKSIESDAQEIPLTVVSKFADVLELIVDVGIGNKWKSKEEGIAEVHRRFYGNLQDMGIRDRVAGEGK